MTSPNPTTRLILVRHGETVWNAEGRLMNQLDSPLSRLGESQAERLGQRMAGVSFDVLYSSNLGRALATAGAISRATGKEIQERKELQERSLGVFAGLTWEEARERFPVEFEGYLHDVDFVVPGGESYRQFHERTANCITELVNAHSGKRIVAVTHGGFLGAAFRHVLRLSLSVHSPASELNTSVNVLEFNDPRWEIRTWGDVSHLDEL